MLKYRGTYRVLYEIDVRKGKACEFSYIPCRVHRGSNICRHSDTILSAYITSTTTAKRLLVLYPDLFTPFQVGSCERTILFKESDMDKAAILLKARVLGKNKGPYPKRVVNHSEEFKLAATKRLFEWQEKTILKG